MINVSVVIVTYNSARVICRCLTAIRENTLCQATEITVVDNASTDETVNLVTDFDSCIRLICNSSNSGFSKACNQGANASSGLFLFFCNPDTFLLSDVCEGASDAFQDTQIGVWSPAVQAPDGHEAPFAFKFPHRPLSLLSTFFKNLVGRSNARILQLNYKDAATLIECDWVLGACMFVRASVFRKVAGFDEDFFLYFEDIDFCKRVVTAGYRVLADRRFTVCHEKYGSSSSVDPKAIRRIRFESEILFYYKHFGVFGWLVSRMLDRNGMLFRS